MFSSHYGEIAALGTAVFYTLNGILFESAGKKVGSLAVNYIRLVVGFILLSTFTYFSRGALLPLDASSHNWTWLSVSGFIGFFLGDLFLFQAYVEVGTRISMLVFGIAPPLTAILGYIFMDEIISFAGIVGMLIITIGIALVILGKDEENNKIKFQHPLKGISYALLGAIGQSVGVIFSKIGMGTYSPFAATQIRIIAGFIAFNILFFYLNKWGDIKKAMKDKKALREISLGALFGPVLGVSSQLISLQHTSAGISATITSIMPVTILPYSILVNKEKLSIKEIIGTMVSVIGVGVLFLL